MKYLLTIGSVPKLKDIRVFPKASTWSYWKQVKGSFRNFYDALAMGAPGIKDMILLTYHLVSVKPQAPFLPSRCPLSRREGG